MSIAKGRRVIGYVTGRSGVFDRRPFYQIRLDKDASAQFDQLLSKGNAAGRCTVAVSVSYHQPDRLRVTEIDPPDYELRAVTGYVRGDTIRIQGREGVSCGLDLSARFGVPLVREQLRGATQRAVEYLVMRIPSRKRDVIEFIPDVDLTHSDVDTFVAGSVTAAMSILPAEEFSDWEK
jgi:hypothetical protein